MKFRVKTIELKKWLDIVNHATASITTTPILENILIKVNFNNVVLTANNLETAIEYTITQELEITSEGAFCVPSKLFTSYVNLVTDDYIEIELTNNELIQVTTVSGEIKIKGIEAEEFPLIPTIREENSLNISWKILKKAIEKTLFSAAEWNIRPTLAWILFNISQNKAIFASTDSLRLSEYKTELKENSIYDFSQIVPSKTASEIKSIIKDDEEIKIIYWDSQIAFFFWNTKFFSRVLNWRFPDYKNFFPTSWTTKAEVNRVDLIQALKKINLISRENSYSIKISFSWELWIIIDAWETQIWEWEIRLSWVIEWEDNIIWINSIFLIEVLNVIDTTHVSISFESPLSPILITPLADPEEKNKNEEFRHIIMPLKIQ